MSEFLRALGYDPLRYWVLAWTCFSLWLLSVLVPYEPRGSMVRRLGSPLAFVALTLLAMIAFRWPTVALYKPVNPDEPQFLAGALTMLARHQFWWPDAMSSGPLVMAPLAIPGLFGLPVDFVTARAIGLLLSWGVVIFTFVALRHVHGERLDRLLAAPLACFMILLDFWDFTAYASEWLPLFLCSAAVALVITAFAADGSVNRRWRLAAAGLVLGILPFGKLQALPLGATIGIAGLVWTWTQPGGGRGRRGRDLAALLGATAAAFLGLAAWAWSSGNGAHLLQAYVRYNVFYAQTRAVPWSDSPGHIRFLADFSWGFSSFHSGMLVLLAIGLFALRRPPRAAWKPIALGLALLASTYYAVLAPGRAYPHYLLLLTMPLALVTGLVLGHTLRSEQTTRRLRIALLSLLAGAGIGGQVAQRLAAASPVIRLAAPVSPRARVDALLNSLKRPGDRLAIWGWRPELYVETQLPQAVRDAHTERQMTASPQRAYFRASFLADLQADPPAFFIDAIGPGGFLYQDRAANGIETFKELDDFINRYYRPLGDFDSFRVYERRDRTQPSS